MNHLVFLSRTNPFQVSSASANRTRGLVEGLISHGAEIHFYICSPFFSNRTKDEFNRIQFKYSGKLKLIQFSLAVFNSSFFQRLYSFFSYPISNFLFANKLDKLLCDFDGVVYTNADYFLMKKLYTLKMKNPNLKIVCEVSEYLDYYKSQEIPWWILPQLVKTESFFINKFVHILSGCVLMTKALYRYIEDLKLPNCYLLHLPMTVDLSRFVDVEPSSMGFRKPYILFIGVMNNAKDGIDILIEAFNQICKKYPDYHLYLVGPWQYDTPGHLERISELGLDQRIFWINEVHRDEIPPLLLEANLLVLPRPDSKQAQGGFPTKLGEYLASGKPVCATSVGELPEYLTDGKSVFFAEPGSVSSFANAINSALGNYNAAIEIGENGKKIAMKFFNKDNQAETLFNFLNILDTSSQSLNN